jgi:hypothetical protein
MKKKMKRGYVAMLDVLGFKEYLSKRQNFDFFSLWKQLKKELNDQKYCIEKEIQGFEDYWHLDVLCLSDTLVLCLSCTDENEENRTILLAHIVIILDSFIDRYFKQGIYFRGAISYGDFICDTKQNIAMGNAIDEASEWHDSTDWIGIILAPSAKYAYEKIILEIPINHPWNGELQKLVNYEVPFKFNTSYKTRAFIWFNIPDGIYMRGLKLHGFYRLLSKSTYSKTVIGKYANTIKFIETILSVDREEFLLEDAKRRNDKTSNLLIIPNEQLDL